MYVEHSLVSLILAMGQPFLKSLLTGPDVGEKLEEPQADLRVYLRWNSQPVYIPACDGTERTSRVDLFVKAVQNSAEGPSDVDSG